MGRKAERGRKWRSRLSLGDRGWEERTWMMECELGKVGGRWRWIWAVAFSIKVSFVCGCLCGVCVVVVVVVVVVVIVV